MENPTNISGDSAGYNTRLWQNQPHDHLVALEGLGYSGSEEDMVLEFQTNWNRVSQVGANNDVMKQLDWVRLICGNLHSDGEIGANTLNALEVAMVNQRNGLIWLDLVDMAKHPVKQMPAGRVFARTGKSRMRKRAAKSTRGKCPPGMHYVVTDGWGHCEIDKADKVSAKGHSARSAGKSARGKCPPGMHYVVTDGWGHCEIDKADKR
jgi:hypothetical protein